jgi:hypothetical protein
MNTGLSRFAQALFVVGVCLGLTSSPAHAAGGVTGTLRGNVVNAQTGAPISGVSVTAASASGTFHATTDAHGFFVLLQMPTDTYDVSLSRDGYTPQVLSGITLLGDQTQSIGTVKLLPAVKTLAHVAVTAHSPTSAFQPTQTVDETTFVGKRLDQALGQAGSTNYNNLALSAPGVIATKPGSLNALSIRG